MQQYDLVIIGGGLVGGSLACALSGCGLRIAVVEAVPASAEHQPSYDERVIALSWGSRRILEAIGVWPDIARRPSRFGRSTSPIAGIAGLRGSVRRMQVWRPSAMSPRHA
jgi:2-polyprenyl-6-methoxyphenol hydroxylase-like FAD-dependent oxidoreductase